MKEKLLLASVICIVISTGLQIWIAYLDDKIGDLKSEKDHDIQKYYAINTTKSVAGMQWEVARMFLVNRDILGLINASNETLARNNFHYHYSIDNAATLMGNAAKAFNFEEGGESKAGAYKEKSTDDEIKRQYVANGLAMVERCNLLIGHYKEIVKEIRSLESTKSIIRTISIILNVIGLFLGFVATRNSN